MNEPHFLPAHERPHWGRRGLAAALCVAAMAFLWFGDSSLGQARETGAATPPPTEPVAWSDEIKEIFGRVPVQDGGRIKPLSTWAKFTLLRMNHTSTLRTPDGGKRSPMDWALDVFFTPQVAIDHRMFLVENDAILTDIGLTFENRKKRDRYSYNELAKGRDALAQRNREIRKEMDARRLKFDDLSPVKKGLLLLGNNLFEFESLTHYFDFGRERAKVPASAELAALFGNQASVSVTEILAKGAELGRIRQAEKQEVAGAMIWATGALLRGTRTLRILPPAGADEKNWTTPAEVAAAAFRGEGVFSEHLIALQQLERAASVSGDSSRFADALRDYGKTVVTLAEGRGEYEKVDLEVRYYNLDPFYKGMLLYFFGFLLLAVTWFVPQGKWVYRVALGFLAVAFALHVYGIVVRSILRERPPVSTLYDTIVFVGAVAVLACFIVERINRRRIAISLVPILGAISLFMARGYEELNRQDTLPKLQAVLDTNYWLTIHVICITIGYSAGLLTGAFAHVYLLGRIFGFKGGTGAFYTVLGRMIYGSLCFALLFSVIGTITGGIWANDSWGRFWGWDPKENGALMICLWQIITLHARLGGYVRPFGMAVMSVFGTVVIAFSWWHVNLLGIGLHSYGFTAGILQNLRIFYFAEAAVILTALGWWFSHRLRSASPAS